MASRGFFGYDPYDYYYTAPYHHYPYHHYPYHYYHHQQQPAGVPARSKGGFSQAAGDAEPPVREAVRARPRPASRSVSIPVHFVGSDPELEREMARKPPTPAVMHRRRALSVEEAAVRIRVAARGFMARTMVRAVREVEREAEEVAAKVACEAESLRGDARARIAVGEALMRLLLRLDAVRGAREYRKRVTKRLLALQDAVDALEPKAAAPAPAAVAEELDAEPTADGMAEEPDAEAAAEEMAEESEVAQDLPDATEQSSVTEAAGEMEVDGGSRARQREGTRARWR